MRMRRHMYVRTPTRKACRQVNAQHHRVGEGVIRARICTSLSLGRHGSSSSRMRTLTLAVLHMRARNRMCARSGCHSRRARDAYCIMGIHSKVQHASRKHAPREHTSSRHAPPSGTCKPDMETSSCSMSCAGAVTRRRASSRNVIVVIVVIVIVIIDVEIAVSRARMCTR